MPDDPNGGAAPAPAAPAAAPAAPAPAPAPAPTAPPAAAPAPAPAASASAPGAPAEPASTILAGKTEQPAPEPAKAPIEYTDFTLPDGVTADAEALTSFKDVARGLGLQQEQAQQLVELYSGRQLAAAQAQQAAQQQLVESWATAARADAEYGGPKFDASVAHAARAMERFASPELRGVLNATGLGNHPEVIRAFVRIGATLGESAFVTGGNVKPQSGTAASMYPNSPQLR